jgi:hypothetical protein
MLPLTPFVDSIEQTGLRITAKGPQDLRKRMDRGLPTWADVVSQIGLRIK